MKRVLVDSDVFIRHLRYSRDANSSANGKFVEWMLRTRKAATTIFNVLEVSGILTFNMNRETLLATVKDFTARFGVKVYWPANREGELAYDFEGVFAQILVKQSLGDAQVAWAAERFRAQTSAFVTWNAKHYQGKIGLPVLTPAEFLRKKTK